MTHQLGTLALFITCSMVHASISKVVCPIQSEMSCERRTKNLCFLLKTDDKSLQNGMRIKKHRKKEQRHKHKHIKLFKGFKDGEINMNNYCVVRSQCYKVEIVDFAKNRTREGWFHVVHGGTCVSSNTCFHPANF